MASSAWRSSASATRRTMSVAPVGWSIASGSAVVPALGSLANPLLPVGFREAFGNG